MSFTAHRVGADEKPFLDEGESVDVNLAIVTSIVLNLSNAVFENDQAKGE